MDPLAGSPWSALSTVAGFSRSAPNATLLDYAQRHQRQGSTSRVLDIGCGAGRNAVPLALGGAEVIGLDLSWAMLSAAAGRDSRGRLRLALASMDTLPIGDRTVNLIVAHGIWNLARSGHEFRRAVAEAARVAVQGAALFVFTFSRHTLPTTARPLPGESFVFTDFSGEPQVFLTADELYEELHAVGFDADPELPLRELNLLVPGQLHRGAPVIYEAGFRRS